MFLEHCVMSQWNMVYFLSENNFSVFQFGIGSYHIPEISGPSSQDIVNFGFNDFTTKLSINSDKSDGF